MLSHGFNALCLKSKRPGYRGKSALRNSSSGRASWLASACLHPNRWHLAFLVSAVVSSFSSCGLLKDSKASGLKWREKRSRFLWSFIRPQASSHAFLLLLSLGKQWSLTLLLLLPFDWKLQPKATQCGIVSVFYFLSCVAVKSQKTIEISASSSPSATIWRHRRRMYCAREITAPPIVQKQCTFF